MNTAREMSSQRKSSPPSIPPARFGARLWRWTKRLLVLAAVGVVLLALVVGGVYLYFSRDLPSVEALRTYALPQVTKVRLRRRLRVRGVLHAPGAPHPGGRHGAAAPRAQRLPRRRGRRLLQARGPRLRRHGPRGREEPHPRQPQVRRLHHHPAGGEEPAAHARAQPDAQDSRVDPHPARGAGPHQGPDPQPVREPDLLRAAPLRRRGGGALLLRQAREGPERRRGRRARRHGAVAQPHQPGDEHRPRQAASALRAGADGRARLPPEGGGGEGAGEAHRARASAAARGGPLLRRGDPPHARRPLRRRGRAHRRPARGHRHGPEAPGDRRRGGARGAGGGGPAPGLPRRPRHAGARALRAAPAPHREAARRDGPAPEGRRLRRRPRLARPDG